MAQAPLEGTKLGGRVSGRCSEKIKGLDIFWTVNYSTGFVIMRVMSVYVKGELAMLPEEKLEEVRELHRTRVSRYRKKKDRKVLNGLLAIGILAVVVGVILLITHLLTNVGEDGMRAFMEKEEPRKVVEERPPLDVQLLTPNPYSRPQTPTDPIRNIVVHYTANPGTTAQNNRDFFEGLKDSKETSVSSNFVIGMEGEIIQCVPTSEVAYASNDRNHDTVSIECCHPGEDGQFTQKTYDSLVWLTAYLLGKFELEPKDIIRHYDVTGKECPKYFVEHEDAWERFKKDVADYIEEHGVLPQAEDEENGNSGLEK